MNDEPKFLIATGVFYFSSVNDLRFESFRFALSWAFKPKTDPLFVIPIKNFLIYCMKGRSACTCINLGR